MSYTTLEIIDRLPFELAARLSADEFFCDIPVVVAEKGNVGLEVKRLQAVQTAKKGGKWGVCVVILQLVLDDDFPNLQFGPVTFRPGWQVIELVEQNRGKTGTGKSARAIGRRIRDVHKCTIIFGLTTSMEFEKNFMTPLALKDMDAAVGYEVEAKCMEWATASGSQVALPAFASAGALLTLTCATEGAEIWYTTDGTYPAPRTAVPESKAALYAGPVAIPDAGFEVRVAGYKAGMIASSPARAEIEP